MLINHVKRKCRCTCLNIFLSINYYQICFSAYVVRHNFSGLVKILKKYDKRTGALIRLPFIQRVLQQPFFTTDLLHKLVKECEVMLDQIIPAREPFVPNEDGNEGSDSDDMRGMYMRSTVAALRTLREIRGGPRR